MSWGGTPTLSRENTAKQTTGVRDFPVLEAILAHLALNRNASPIFQEKHVIGYRCGLFAGCGKVNATSVAPSIKDSGIQAQLQNKKHVRDESQGLNTFSQRVLADTARSQPSTNQMHYHCDMIQHTLLLV